MSENLDIWRQLSKTDPDQVKDFQRAGGFRGHAVRPIYVIQKMTQIFGPCGHGWSIDKPDFTTVRTEDGLVSVHCTVGVRVKFPEGSGWSEPIHGVGGDQAVASRKSGKFVDDEAFKKAFTDAVGNALKFLGMSADIHMGRFDDSKYVADLRNEKAEVRQSRQNGNGGGGYQDRYVRPAQDEALPDHDAETGELFEDGKPSDAFADLGDELPPPTFKNGREVMDAIERAKDLGELAIVDQGYQAIRPRMKAETVARIDAAMQARLNPTSETTP